MEENEIADEKGANYLNLAEENCLPETLEAEKIFNSESSDIDEDSSNNGDDGTENTDESNVSTNSEPDDNVDASVDIDENNAKKSKKKIGLFILIIILAVVLVGAIAAVVLYLIMSPVKENVEILYGESYDVESKKLDKYETLVWTSEDETIAFVDNGTITGNKKGETTVYATVEEKNVAEINVEIVTIPVENVVLSTNTCEMTVDEEYQMAYTLFPDNASGCEINWSSTDDDIVNVDENGILTAISPGQTNITISNESGLLATCLVTVKQKPAYERLSEDEKSFVDLFLKEIDTFKYPDSVVIKRVYAYDFEETGLYYVVKASAANAFGASSDDYYLLTKKYGLQTWTGMTTYLGLSSTGSYDEDLINEAIAEKR